MSIKKITFILAVVAGLSGCNKQPEVTPAALPEVNEANCQPSIIEGIADVDLRKDFATQCLHRGKFTPSKPKAW